MRFRSVLLTTAACLVLAAVGASVAAAAPPVLGAADGVQATLTGRTIEVRFTATSAAGAAIAGRQVQVSCRAHPYPPGLQLTNDGDAPGAYGFGRADAQSTVRVRLSPAAKVDACDVQRVEDDSSAPVLVARVAFDPAGETWNDEAVRSAPLRNLLDRAHAATGYRPIATMVGGTVVGMDGPSATPPPGQVGYWTDGDGHAAAATYSAAGRRLAIEDLGHGMLRTNVLVQGDVLASLTDGLFDGLTPSPGSKPKHASRYHADEPVVPADGVHAHLAGRRLTVRFTGHAAAGFRAIAGRRVAIGCLRQTTAALFGDSPAPIPGGAARVRVPRHGGTVTATLSATGDFCVIVDAGTSVAFAPATAAGRRWYADLRALMLLDALPERLFRSGATAYPTPAAIVAAHPKLVAMGSRGAAVPVGRIGVWTDGGPHALVASSSASGHRYVLADEGDGMLRSNVYSGLFSLLVAAAADRQTPPPIME